MNKSSFSLKSLVLAGLLACVPLTGANAASIALVASGDTTLSDANITVGLNDVFSLELWALGFPGLLDGGAVGFSYSFDNFTATDFTPAAGIFPLAVPSDNGTTVTGIGGYNAGAGDAGGNYLLGTLAFTADALGTSIFTLFEDPGLFFSFGFGTQCFSGNACADNTTLGALGVGSATVSVVPLPAAVWLFGSALIGLVGLSRRQKQ